MPAHTLDYILQAIIDECVRSSVPYFLVQGNSMNINVRHLDDVPHIIRYGMHDDKTGNCWIFFWRNGVRFKIHVDKDDVQDTTFYEKLKPLLREHARGEMPLSQWAEQQWHPLCDLIISTSMPTLIDLAPKREYWTTLRDYIHTPAYRLRLIASDDRTEILTKVEEGPTDTGAYELKPASTDKLALPTDVKLYQSSDLHVLNREKNWRQRPAKVSAPDGSVFFFMGCEGDTRDSKTAPLRNPSLNAIRAQLKFMEALTGHSSAILPGNIPQVCGVVVDGSAPMDLPGSLLQEGGQESTSSEQRIAGLLITWIPRGKTLAQTIQSLAGLQDIDIEAKSQAWKSRIGVALGYLHQSGVFVGGRDDWAYLNQYTVLIDGHGEAWLNVSYNSQVGDMSAEEAEVGMERDEHALVKLFEEWLPEEVAKKRSA